MYEYVNIFVIYRLYKPLILDNLSKISGWIQGSALRAPVRRALVGYVLILDKLSMIYEP